MAQDYEFDLNGWRREITTSSPKAQTWFDRGLSWTYGYNHEEAVFCFREALRHDPGCAMAWWGIAYASGPFYNRPWIRLTPAEIAQTGSSQSMSVTPCSMMIPTTTSAMYVA